MILYHGSGAQDFELTSRKLESDAVRQTCVTLLEARRELEAAVILNQMPFELWEGTNFFGDEFHVLSCALSVDQYSVVIEGLDDLSKFGTLAATYGELGFYVRFIEIGVLVGGLTVIESPSLPHSSEAVRGALMDALEIIRLRGPSRGFDRLHTAFHGYLIHAARDSGIAVSPEASVAALFKALRLNHSALGDRGSWSTETTKLMNSMANIVDILSPLRNSNSAAHPNDEILPQAEAGLYVNAVYTLFHYLEAKFAPNP